MSKDEIIREYLPNTKRLSKETFFDFLDRYGEIIVKPSNGFGGYGVIQVTALDNDKYQFHIEYKKTVIIGREEAFIWLMEKHCKNRLHIVQQKIPILEIDSCPFDIRVMVQRKSISSEWVITGVLAKVAEKGFIITNMAKEVLPLKEALMKSNLVEKNIINFLITELDSISLLCAFHLGEFYPKYRQIGFDIGIDAEGNIWIIEANFKPVIRAFKMLNDKKMLRIIREYRKGS